MEGTTGAWLGRYLEPDTIRSDGAFARFATRRLEDGAACVVITGAGGALAELARAHREVLHPSIPPVTHQGDLFVELASDARIDGIELVARCIAQRRTLEHAQLDALVIATVDALRAAASCGRFAGRLSLASLLVSARGELALIGLGHRVAVDDERGAIAVAHAVFQAPEVGAGGAASASGDLIACWQLWKALLALAELPDPLARALRGEPRDEDAPIAAALREMERWASESADRRAGYDEGQRRWAALRAAIGVEPDPEGLSRVLGDVALGLDPALRLDEWGEATEESVALGPAGAWIDTARGERVKLGPALRNVLALLLQRHAEDPGRTTSTWELLEIGWPGESIQPDAGANRVYATIRRLRNMGLRGVIERHDDGYRIVPGAQITWIQE
ncbi:helix-turn-helix domain-containing protein [Sandaracinus amylolyticus]|uniref:OmpR/PhoB-type domain-containing protein n=1 Tax=Sandaracinus amylolyticus TaxID=927083 RepID=A0A0F6YGD1_9BACT|nr:helix-turn-helix domain-containing protein [Sandaracinus amylolyticus]AKF03526.1 hypothetical protein DB32_000675 [Sandaracinus amylolyticus]